MPLNLRFGYLNQIKEIVDISDLLPSMKLSLVSLIQVIFSTYPSLVFRWMTPYRPTP
ncbi:conserved hypothetical protein [Vibrio crassostreae]|nr:conserved hypothetical protein [Vibrio crassostreae]CAK2996439.1 conserved hypothetical protein [Vibrio crassostreae]CAK4001621.1 conserved hypothetical protein [Vibrio crassostreae]